MPQDAFVWAADGRIRQALSPVPRRLVSFVPPSSRLSQILSQLFPALKCTSILLVMHLQSPSYTAPPSSPIEILIAYAAPLPPPGQSDCNFTPSCLVGYRMNVMKSGLQNCVRRQRAAAARACCDALAKQDLGQVIIWLRWL